MLFPTTIVKLLLLGAVVEEDEEDELASADEELEVKQHSLASDFLEGEIRHGFL